MVNSYKLLIVVVLLLKFSIGLSAPALPAGFVYLKDIDPSIIQDMRYASSHNFIGQPIVGYLTSQCILTRDAALALTQVQQKLKPRGLSLMVFDCYRPQMAVDEFVAWSRQPQLQQMKAEFYPRTNKAEVFKLGYVASRSGHTRGSTVDLTVVALPLQRDSYIASQPLVSCFAPFGQRFRDGGVDMGTGFDCLDKMAHFNATPLENTALRNRKLLRSVMQAAGFAPYAQEWWHFTLEKEPFPDTYFNFPVTK